MNAIIGCLFDFQFLGAIFYQIIDAVEVKLNKTNSNSKLSCLHSLLDGGKNVLYGSMKVSFFILRFIKGFTAEYGVSFACACLAIGKKCCIVPIKHRID